MAILVVNSWNICDKLSQMHVMHYKIEEHVDYFERNRPANSSEVHSSYH
jgi:3-methyladenine DNA glycosylase AlkD